LKESGKCLVKNPKFYWGLEILVVGSPEYREKFKARRKD